MSVSPLRWARGGSWKRTGVEMSVERQPASSSSTRRGMETLISLEIQLQSPVRQSCFIKVWLRHLHFMQNLARRRALSVQCELICCFMEIREIRLGNTKFYFVLFIFTRHVQYCYNRNVYSVNSYILSIFCICNDMQKQLEFYVFINAELM